MAADDWQDVDDWEDAPTETPSPKPAEPPSLLSKVGDALSSLASGPAAHGLVQGGSYGFGDELQGAMAAGLEGAKMLGRKAGIVEPLSEEENVFAGANPAAGEGVLERLKSAYTKERDAARAEDEAAQAAAPKTYGAAALTASVLAPGPKALRGGTTAAKALNAGKTGAKLGALAGLGTTDAGDALDMAGDVAGGALVGAAGGALSSAVASKLAPYLRKLAEKRAFASLNPRVALGQGDKLKELEALSPKSDPLQALRALGRRALDEKIVKPLGTAEGAAKRAGAALEDSGQMQGAMLQAIQDANPTARVSPSVVAKALEAQASKASESSAQQGLAGLLRNRAATQRDAMLNRLQSKGTGLLTLPEAEAEKRLLQDEVRRMSANYQKKGSNSLEATRRAASAMRQAVEDAAEKAAGPEDLAQWLALKKRTGDLAKVNEIASYGANRQARSDVGGLSEMADAIGRRMPGSESRSFATRAGDYALDALGRAWRERRPATAARALDAVGSSPLLERVPARSAVEQYMQFLEEKDTP